MNLESLYQLEGKQTVLIMGLGQENLQFLDWLLKVVKIKPTQIVLADKNPALKLDYDIPVSQHFFGENYLKSLELSGVKYVFKSPGIWSLMPELESFRLKNGQDSICSSLIFFFQKYRDQIVAITGTKGKSTTSSLVNHLLNNFEDGVSSVYCGNTTNISPYSFWTEVDQEINPNQYFVVETSSFQLQDLGFAKISPKYSIITNYYVDHLDQHHDKSEYWKAKDNIYKYQQNGDCLVSTEQLLSARPSLLSTGEGSKTVVSQALSEKISSILDSKLIGAHNTLNLALAVVMIQIMLHAKDKSMDSDSLSRIIEEKQIVLTTALAKFLPLSHRLELVHTHSFEFDYLAKARQVELHFYDDGYATEPDAVIAAIKALTVNQNEFLWLIISGIDKGSSLDNLAREILSLQLKNQLYRVDYTGQVGQNLLEHIYSNIGVIMPVDDLESLKELVETEFDNLQDLESEVEEYLGERWSNLESIEDQTRLKTELEYPKILFNIVLSPCGSSFDEFKNSVERAEWWTQSIQKLA
jgi:UDP-N-acetylmuramoyl-L-alanine---L-glutamate ligase